MDGNCFYRSIAYCLTNNEGNYFDAKIKINNYLLENKDKFVEFFTRDDDMDQIAKLILKEYEYAEYRWIRIAAEAL